MTNDVASEKKCIPLWNFSNYSCVEERATEQTMPTQEAQDFYYSKGKQDFLVGFYDQPFPTGSQMQLDEFEKLCNRSYKNGYGDAQDELKKK